ncbi:hypothetical protein [Streptomyces sp. ME19-01-6]|uniref:hypothetical protein n=1 Tax=Streptomyces sp. ME19-01-6 TaxID=3028686 RepID=UPI0029AC45CF|nr:hypothetical protein [Streptomyces sp. ME19-01-6]MDX3230329.1 hypothetical protein [Streptomyces sp. ME19-01-6]
MTASKSRHRVQSGLTRRTFATLTAGFGPTLPATVEPRRGGGRRTGRMLAVGVPDLAKLDRAAHGEVARPKVYHSISRRLWRRCPRGRHR